MAAPVLPAFPSAVRGLRVEEYDALVDAGLLEGEPVQLVEGALVEMAPTSPEHSSTVQQVARALRTQLVVEVARSSVELDTTAEPAVCAGAGVAEHWVVDVGRRLVHVHRRPVAGAYDEVTVHRRGPVTSATEPSFRLDPDAVLPPAAEPV